MGRDKSDDDNVVDVDKWADEKNKENDKLAKELGFNVPDEENWPDSND